MNYHQKSKTNPAWFSRELAHPRLFDYQNLFRFRCQKESGDWFSHFVGKGLTPFSFSTSHHPLHSAPIAPTTFVFAATRAGHHAAASTTAATEGYAPQHEQGREMERYGITSEDAGDSARHEISVEEPLDRRGSQPQRPQRPEVERTSRGSLWLARYPALRRTS
jgi:hypothetical protein